MALAGTKLAAVAALDLQIQSKGVPLIGISGPPWVITFDPSATQAQKDQANAIAAAFDGKDRVFRDLSDIRGSLQALSTGQFGNVWNDLSAAAGAVPRKYLTDTGPNVGAIFCYDHVIYVVGGTAVQIRAGQLSLAALYVQDNAYYLDQPAFDTSISVLGVKPAP